MREVEEKVAKSVSRKIKFEKSGEIFSVTICIENTSPDFQMDSAKTYLNVLYEDALKSIF